MLGVVVRISMGMYFLMHIMGFLIWVIRGLGLLLVRRSRWRVSRGWLREKCKKAFGVDGLMMDESNVLIVKLWRDGSP